jgi:hypothetical protein
MEKVLAEQANPSSMEKVLAEQANPSSMEKVILKSSLFWQTWNG